MTITALRPRNCVLDEETHTYRWDPEGENIQMATSVTPVVNLNKGPYTGDPRYGEMGTHIHRCGEALAKGLPIPSPISPEGHDCTCWFQQMQLLPIWDKVEILGSEYTMTSRTKSLGGQADLIYQTKDGRKIILDFKSKQRSWSKPYPGDIDSYASQMGGYFDLLNSGDDARGGCWIDECVIAIIKPTEYVLLPALDIYRCSNAWSDSWNTYLAHKQANPF